MKKRLLFVLILFLFLSCKKDYLIVTDAVGQNIINTQFRDTNKIDMVVINDFAQIKDIFEKNKHKGYLVSSTLVNHICQIKSLYNISPIALSEVKSYNQKCNDGTLVESIDVSYEEAFSEIISNATEKSIIVSDRNLLEGETTKGKLIKVSINIDSLVLNILDLIQNQEYDTVILLNKNRSEILARLENVRVNIISYDLGILANKLDNVPYDIGYTMSDVIDYLKSKKQIKARVFKIKEPKKFIKKEEHEDAEAQKNK